MVLFVDAHVLATLLAKVRQLLPHILIVYSAFLTVNHLIILIGGGCSVPVDGDGGS